MLRPRANPSVFPSGKSNGTSATYLASDGREIGFTRTGSGYAVEPGVAHFSLARTGSGFTPTSFDQLRMLQ